MLFQISVPIKKYLQQEMASNLQACLLFPHLLLLIQQIAILYRGKNTRKIMQNEIFNVNSKDAHIEDFFDYFSVCTPID